MKIQYMSDLHLEFDKMQVPGVFADVLVLAGDIHIGTQALSWVTEACSKFEHVIYVMGNHEFYGMTMQRIINDWKAVDIPNLHVLNNNNVTLDGVNFIGSTLWSKVDHLCPLNDFRLITYKYAGGYGTFTTKQANEEFIKNLNYLINATKEGNRNVVITHHAPSWKAQAPWYDDYIVGSGFNTDVLENFDNVNLWIYGHTHYNTEFTENGIKVVTNQRGYKGHELLHDFAPHKYLEV